MYFCVVGMLLCLFLQFFLLYFGTLPTVWYLFWFFIWFQIQNEWTHFTTILFYTKHTEHPLITNSCDVQMQVEQYWYHRLSNDLDLKLGFFWILILVISFILGNEHLHQLTAQGNYSLRINIGDFDSNQRYAVYSQFVVGDEESGYKLTVGGYEGSAGMS